MDWFKELIKKCVLTDCNPSKLGILCDWRDDLGLGPCVKLVVRQSNASLIAPYTLSKKSCLGEKMVELVRCVVCLCVNENEGVCTLVCDSVCVFASVRMCV